LERTERVRVCLEASGNYSLDLALFLHAQRGGGTKWPAVQRVVTKAKSRSPRLKKKRAA
jgi:hypothetical protein